MEKTMDKIVQVAKARGFVYPGSEIYGGLANTWDYGNLGVELKNNVKRDKGKRKNNYTRNKRFHFKYLCCTICIMIYYCKKENH